MIHHIVTRIEETGPMFSGKTRAIRRLRLVQIAKQRVQIFKAAIDKRYHDEFSPHSDQKFRTPVKCRRNIDRGATRRVVGVGTAQFHKTDSVRCLPIGLCVAAAAHQTIRQSVRARSPSLCRIDFEAKAAATCGGEATKTQRLPESEHRWVGRGIRGALPQLV
jgi:hypothetical protein